MTKTSTEVFVSPSLPLYQFQYKSPRGKPWGPRLYYSNNYLGSVGVYLVSPERYWIENLPGFIRLVAQTLTDLIQMAPVLLNEI